MFEIRNYHYEPTKFDKYQKWATKEAVPYLREHLDLVGFWMDNGEATGSRQYHLDHPMGLNGSSKPGACYRI